MGCLEVAIQTVTVLVSRGWRTQLAPQLGKQLLIMMSLLAGADPSKRAATPSAEVKAAAFECIASIMKWSDSVNPSEFAMNQQSSTNLVDQLVYILAEDLAENTHGFVQVAAAHALLEIFQNISIRILLASLLPRTVSSAVKALKPNSHAFRSTKVLTSTLQLLRAALYGVLGGDIAVETHLQNEEERATLDESWMKATAAQVRNALIQVTKLRTHDRTEVRETLSDLCVMIIESCGRSLPESIPIVVETMVILSSSDSTGKIAATFKHLITSQPHLADILRSNFYDWTQAFARVMQTNDNLPKEIMIRKLTSSYGLVLGNACADDSLIGSFTSAMVNGVTNLIDHQMKAGPVVQDIRNTPLSLNVQTIDGEYQEFRPVLLGHQSQQILLDQFQNCIESLKEHLNFGQITRDFVDAAASSRGHHRISALWLAIQCLSKGNAMAFQMGELVITESVNDQNTYRTCLINDLYSVTKEILTQLPPHSDPEIDWQLAALSLEALVLQSKHMGVAYREEFYETLYPVLALLSSTNSIIHHNAVVALNQLVSACHYTSAQEMLIQNVDYLVNSIAWKLNIFNLSPQAPQVLNMMLKLVGAKLVPHLDDLITSIFAALDSFHGYPSWVEMMFSVLKTLIDECVHQPELATGQRNTIVAERQAPPYIPSNADFILSDLRARRLRRSYHSPYITDQEATGRAPRQPWKDDENHDSNQPNLDEGEISIDSMLKQDQDADLPVPSTSQRSDEDLMKPLNKTHGLLLKIAQATIPHLASPSPEVRHLLLNLLARVSPLLACHENTFLPFINTVWPSLVARLFGFQTDILQYDRDDAYSQGDIIEASYNIIAATDVVTILCRSASDFMSSRVEQIFQKLIKLFNQTHQNVRSRRNNGHQSNILFSMKQISAGTTAASSKHVNEQTTDLRQGVVGSQIIRPRQSAAASYHGTQANLNTAFGHTTVRSSQSQILISLIELLTTILCHVSITASLADEIITSLTPCMAEPEHQQQGPVSEIQRRVCSAVKHYNPDLLWLIRLDAKVFDKDQIDNGDEED